MLLTCLQSNISHNYIYNVSTTFYTYRIKHSKLIQK